MSKYKLYTDNEVFNREYPFEYKLSDIMIAEGISGRARITQHVGNSKQYRVDNSGFEFSIHEVLEG